ncbi:ABC transporter permease subunit [Romeriopsis navalis]|uniref:ABC transporter permease subunit n=1 Tax=Romeriopsis navalis TaxID=2992132 RepID=UPI0029C9E144|nr:hypothetical protein [Romeriopsis navalis]
MMIATRQQRRAKKSPWVEVGIVMAIALAAIVILPLALPAFRLKLFGRFFSLAIAALGIDLIWGYTGLLSLGHGIFFALGGYAIAMFLKLQLPDGQLPEFFTLYGVKELPWFWEPFHSLPFTLIALWLIPMIVSGLLGYLVFRNRIRGVYFSILTQAMLLVFYNFFNGQQKLINGTNGLKPRRPSYLVYCSVPMWPNAIYSSSPSSFWSWPTGCAAGSPRDALATC